MRLIQGFFVFCLAFLPGLGFQAAAAKTVIDVYEWEGYISNVKEAFEQHAKENGMDVELNILTPYITGPDDIYEYARTRRADFITPTNNYYKLSNGKLMKNLHPLDFSRMRNYEQVIEDLRRADYDERNGEKYSVPLLGGSYGLAYNAALVEAPDSWEVLWDPAHRGKVSVTGSQIEANFYNALLLEGVDPSQFYDFYDANKDRAKRSALEARILRLVTNVDHFWTGMAGDFGDGIDKPVMDTLSYASTYWFVISEMKKRGGDWRMASPKEGQTIWLDTMAITRHVAQDPEKLAACYLLMDFMLTAPIQRAINANWGSVIVNKAVATEMGLDDFFAETKFLWQPLSQRTRNYYINVWRNALKQAGKGDTPGGNRE